MKKYLNFNAEIVRFRFLDVNHDPKKLQQAMSQLVFHIQADYGKRQRRGVECDMEDIAKLLDSVSKLIGTLVWPGIITLIAFRYKSSISEFVESIGELTMKGGGFEASLRRKQAEATAKLVTATVARSEADATPEMTASDVYAAAAAVQSVTVKALRQASKARVLWVDDRPDNNEQERGSLEAFGVDFIISTSTDDAMAKIRNQKFDIIISDMGRPDDPKAGYTLLQQIRDYGLKTPFVIYAGSRSPEHVAEAKRRGAMGCTNRPDELFEYVLKAISRAD